MSDDDKGKKKGGKSPIMLIGLLLVGLVGGVMFTKVTGSKSATATAEPAPEPGEIAGIDAININLANGHFLRIAVGAQLTKEVTVKAEDWGKTEAAKVRDVIIDEFSGKTLEELSTAQGRRRAVEELTERSIEKTEKQVMAIYLNEFVMQ